MEDGANQNEFFQFDHYSIKKQSRSPLLWIGIAIVISFAINAGLAVGLYYKSHDERFSLQKNANPSFQSQVSEKNQSSTGNKYDIQAKNIENLQKLVEKLSNNLQLQNSTFQRKFKQQEFRLQKLIQEQQNYSKIAKAQNFTLPQIGWYTPWNGYQYRLTRNANNWQRTRNECLFHGADLASVGMRNFNTRRLIKNALQNTILWVGFTDIHIEGDWMWVDGRAANISEVMWLPGQPDNHGRQEHCGQVGWRNNYLMSDANCNSEIFGICEKSLY